MRGCPVSLLTLATACAVEPVAELVENEPPPIGEPSVSATVPPASPAPVPIAGGGTFSLPSSDRFTVLVVARSSPALPLTPVAGARVAIRREGGELVWARTEAEGLASVPWEEPSPSAEVHVFPEKQQVTTIVGIQTNAIVVDVSPDPWKGGLPLDPVSVEGIVENLAPFGSDDPTIAVVLPAFHGPRSPISGSGNYFEAAVREFPDYRVRAVRGFDDRFMVVGSADGNVFGSTKEGWSPISTRWSLYSHLGIFASSGGELGPTIDASELVPIDRTLTVEVEDEEPTVDAIWISIRGPQMDRASDVSHWTVVTGESPIVLAVPRNDGSLFGGAVVLRIGAFIHGDESLGYRMVQTSPIPLTEAAVTIRSFPRASARYSRRERTIEISASDDVGYQRLELSDGSGDSHWTIHVLGHSPSVSLPVPPSPVLDPLDGWLSLNSRIFAAELSAEIRFEDIRRNSAAWVEVSKPL